MPNKPTILTATSAGRINNINSYVASNSPPKVAPNKSANILVATKQGAPIQRTTVVNNYNSSDNGSGFLTGMLIGHALSQQPQHVTVVNQTLMARTNESPTVVGRPEQTNNSAYALSGFKGAYCGGSAYCDTVGYKNPF